MGLGYIIKKRALHCANSANSANCANCANCAYCANPNVSRRASFIQRLARLPTYYNFHVA